jgi:hypothetical protein
VTDSGQFDPLVPGAGQIAVEKLPDEASWALSYADIR